MSNNQQRGSIMAFMELFITNKGRMASCDCEKCGTSMIWHEWVNDGQAVDLKKYRCDECGGPMDAKTYWESPKRNYYAAQYSAPGYLDQTSWEFDTNKKRLLKTVRELYGED
jgi:NAD-dependent SIR2 family protein deacetylase